jgi:hypothetical protein
MDTLGWVSPLPGRSWEVSKERIAFKPLPGACFDSLPYELKPSGHWLFSVFPFASMLMQLYKWKLRYIFSGKLNPYHRSRRGVLFIHIPKNAGSSFVESLYGSNVRSFHFAAQFYRLINKAKFDAVLKVAVVRNPDERFVSAVNYNRQLSGNIADQEFAKKHLSSDSPIEICSMANEGQQRFEGICKHTHFRRQVSYVCDADGKLIVDLLISMDDLSAGLKEIEKFTGREYRIAHRNSSQRMQNGFKLSGRMRDFYDADYQLWNYVSQAKDGIVWVNDRST